MKIGILGSGVVGKTLGSRLVELGHEVRVGTRQAEKLNEWLSAVSNTDQASVGSFAEAAGFGELVINATSGAGALEALQLAGEEQLNGKILIDISNPLDFSKGMPPTLLVSNTDSLGEQIQAAFPNVKVVKALNTVSVDLMGNPSKLSDADHVSL
jgi:predicted dinucleotide-binding enzyme